MFLTGPRAKPFRFPDLETISIQSVSAKPVVFTQKPLVFTTATTAPLVFTTATTIPTTVFETSTSFPTTKTTATATSNQLPRIPKEKNNDEINENNLQQNIDFQQQTLELFEGVPTGNPGMVLDSNLVSSLPSQNNQFSPVRQPQFVPRNEFESFRNTEPVFRAPAPVPSSPVISSPTRPPVFRNPAPVFSSVVNSAPVFGTKFPASSLGFSPRPTVFRQPKPVFSTPLLNSSPQERNPGSFVTQIKTISTGSRQRNRQRQRNPPGEKAPVRNSFNRFIQSHSPISEHFQEEQQQPDPQPEQPKSTPVDEGPGRKTFTFRIPKTVNEPKPPPRSFSYVFNILGESSFAYNVSDNQE